MYIVTSKKLTFLLSNFTLITNVRDYMKVLDKTTTGINYKKLTSATCEIFKISTSVHYLQFNYLADIYVY